ASRAQMLIRRGGLTQSVAGHVLACRRRSRLRRSNWWCRLRAPPRDSRRPLRLVRRPCLLFPCRSGTGHELLERAGIEEEVLLDQLFAAPGLPSPLFHHALGSIFAGELETPADRGVIAVEQERPEPRRLHAGNAREHPALLRG